MIFVVSLPQKSYLLAIKMLSPRSVSAATPYALIIDDHPLYGRGIAALLVAHGVVTKTHIAAYHSECVKIINQFGAPVITIADFWLASGAAIELITKLKVEHNISPVIIVSADNDPVVSQRALDVADGFVHKQTDTDVFMRAVVTVMQGGRWHDEDKHVHTADAHLREIPISSAVLGLSARQAQILALVLQGYPNKRIAASLSLSESTVKEHITGILYKLNVKNRVEAIAKLRGYRLVVAD